MKSSMRNFIGSRRLLLPVLALVCLSATVGSARAEVYTFTIQNLTRGQHFTPPLAIAHSDSVSVFTLGAAPSAALVSLAEEGMTGALADAVNGDSNVNGVAVAATVPVAPGASVNVCVATTDATHSRLSLAGMLLPTNDGFVALNSAEAPAAGSVQSWYLNAYDAGSEGNSELSADIPQPPFLTGNFAIGTGGAMPFVAETAGEGLVHIHRGVLGDANATGGNSDVNSSVHRWLNPVGRVTVTVATGSACPSS